MSTEGLRTHEFEPLWVFVTARKTQNPLIFRQRVLPLAQTTNVNQDRGMWGDLSVMKSNLEIRRLEFLRSFPSTILRAGKSQITGSLQAFAAPHDGLL